MAFPKWKYRKHPTLGVFQSTLVLTEKAEAELESGWSDDPGDTGFEVRQSPYIHPSHITDGLPLHEPVPRSGQEVITITTADVAIITGSDKHG